LKPVRIFALWLFVFFQSLTPCTAAEVSDSAAIDVVAHFQSVLLSLMRDANGLGFEGRYKRLEPELRRSHDLARVAHLTIGRYWRTLNAQQQSRFVDTFSRLVIATYAHQFHTYAGESFNRKSVQPLKRGRVRVRTELVKSNGKRIHLDYVLHHRKGRWLIINIIADGVSDLALKRAEYSNILGTNGINHLISLLERKIIQYQ